MTLNNEITTTRLQELEQVIERGLMDVGQALQEIRTEKLYLPKNGGKYNTFEDYCRVRWGFGRDYAKKQMRAVEVIDNIKNDTIVSFLPQTETQARPLTTLKDPDQQRAAWAEAVETAPNGKITAAHVQTVVNGYNGKAMKPKENKAGDIYEPKGYDACQTPPYAVEPLLPYLSRFGIIWEPAAGEGHLANALATLGRSIITSDILTGENFFNHEPPEWDALVTNPPYSIKYEWMSRCYDLGKPFALLLPVETLGAVQAQLQFKRHDVSVMFLSSRVNFKMPSHDRFGMGAAQFPVAWFCWKIPLDKQIVFAEIYK